MRILKIISSAILAMILPACIYVPVSNNDAESATCKTFTHSMSLDKIDIGSPPSPIFASGSCSGSPCAAFVAGQLAVVAAVSAGSVIISGSIAVTDNTIHWLEYQGTCSDGYLSRAKNKFLNSINSQHAEQ